MPNSCLYAASIRPSPAAAFHFLTVLVQNPPEDCYTRAVVIIRDKGVISGFRYENPIPELPSLTHCGEVFCDSSHALEPHSHRSYEFHYMVHGTAYWKIGDFGQTFTEGGLLWSLPGLTHRSTPQSHSEYHHLWIGLHLRELGREGQELDRELRAYAREGSFILDNGRSVEPILRALILQISSPRKRALETCVSYIQTFVALMRQLVAERGEARGEPRPYCYPVQKALEYMRSHVHDRIPIEKLASVSGLGLSQFNWHFRHDVGHSPGKYQQRIRLEAAREELTQRESSITQVALEYGFSSSQHFSTAFRGCFGVTPRAWQLNQGGGSPAPRPAGP
jgi:AraC-like DNA-binding protein